MSTKSKIILEAAMRNIAFLFFTICALAGCKHSTDFSLQPDVSYSHDIAPVIISNCAQSGCHGTVSPAKFALLSYDDLMTYTAIKPGSPDGSDLIKVITSLRSDDVMPQKPYNPLTDQQIQTIYLWIGQGAKNN